MNYSIVTVCSLYGAFKEISHHLHKFLKYLQLLVKIKSYIRSSELVVPSGIAVYCAVHTETWLHVVRTYANAEKSHAQKCFFFPNPHPISDERGAFVADSAFPEPAIT